MQRRWLTTAWECSPSARTAPISASRRPTPTGARSIVPSDGFPFKGTARFRELEHAGGQGDDPSIETRYTARPRLDWAPTWAMSIPKSPRVSTGGQSPGYTRRGGLYEVTFHDYHDTSGGLYSFQKLDAEVIQHIPLLRETWVLAGASQSGDHAER